MRAAVRALLILLLLAATPAFAAQVLRVGINQLPSAWGNPYAADGTPNSYVWSTMFDGLTRLEGDYRIGPALATGWRRTSDTVWRFELRRGVRFSNGEPFDAAAVVAAFRWLGSPEGRLSIMGGRFKQVVAVRAVGPYTVELRTSAPDSILPQRLATLAMVAPRAWARLGPKGFAETPEGTGPYRLVDWGRASRRAVLVANPGAFRPARIPRLEIVELPETAARVQALLSRDVDIAMVGIDDLDLLTARGFAHVLAPSMQVMSLGFIVEGRPNTPLADPRVRRALNLAVDRRALAEVLLRGRSVPAAQPASRVTVGYDPAIAPYRHDVAEARRLLAAAGHGRGLRLTAEVVPNAMPADTLIYQAVVADLRRVGVEVDLRSITFNEWLRKFVSGRWTTDMAGMAWNSAAFNDSIRAMENFSCKKPKPFFCDPAMMPLFDAVEASSGAPRLAALRRLSKAFHEAAPALYLVEQVDLFAYSPSLAGVELVGRAPAYERIGVSPGVSRSRR